MRVGQKNTLKKTGSVEKIPQETRAQHRFDLRAGMII
jgi:hypothetical protein